MRAYVHRGACRLGKGEPSRNKWRTRNVCRCPRPDNPGGDIEARSPRLVSLVSVARVPSYRVVAKGWRSRDDKFIQR